MEPISATAAESKPRQERIEEIEVHASGIAGRIRTSPIYLDGAPGLYHFGQPFCPKTILAPAMLEQLHSALRSGQPIRVSSRPGKVSDGKAVRCITAVSFFAPQPG